MQRDDHALKRPSGSALTRPVEQTRTYSSRREVLRAAVVMASGLATTSSLIGCGASAQESSDVQPRGAKTERTRVSRGRTRKKAAILTTESGSSVILTQEGKQWTGAVVDRTGQTADDVRIRFQDGREVRLTDGIVVEGSVDRLDGLSPRFLQEIPFEEGGFAQEYEAFAEEHPDSTSRLRVFDLRTLDPNAIIRNR